MDEARAGPVDEEVGDPGGDDLPPQRVAGPGRGEALVAQRRREVGGQLPLEPGVLAGVGGQQPGRHVELGVGQQQGELGAGEAGAGRAPLGQDLVGGQELDGPVEAALALQLAEVAGVDVDHRRRLGPGGGQRPGLVVVVPQHHGRHLAGHLGQDPVALADGHLPVGHDGVEQDLDVDLVVGAVDAAGVVDGVGVDPPAGQGELDAAPLGEAEAAALPHHSGPELGGVDADGVVGLVADLGVGLGRRLPVGADAAVPEQVDRRPQHGLDQLGRPQRLGLHAEDGPHLGRQRDRLGRAGEHAASGRDHARVVVGPRRPGQVEEPLPLGGAGGRVGVGVEEQVAVVEGRHQLEGPGAEHPVAEHVARHVADADRRDRRGVGVDPEVAEVALHRLPGALGRDAHLLVVVARRATGGEGVAQPEAVLGGDGVGQVGERGRALVGRHHQIGVVAVVGPHRRRMDDLAADDVVGQVEQS